MATFKTIRQTAALGILPENRLRLMHKEGRIPGVFSGSRFLVHVEALVSQLEAEACGEKKTGE